MSTLLGELKEATLHCLHISVHQCFLLSQVKVSDSGELGILRTKCYRKRISSEMLQNATIAVFCPPDSMLACGLFSVGGLNDEKLGV